MPVTQTNWKCDRDSVEGSSPNEQFPEGWSRVMLSASGIAPISGVLCPVCTKWAIEALKLKPLAPPAR